jgi:5-methyltetrahydrofolate--homocysteine methyltransferase
LLIGEDSIKAGTIIIGTVMGDLHDLGKNLVGMMLESNGFEVINLGADISPEEFVEAAIKNDAQIIGMSALLTTTMKNMEKTIKKLEEAGLKDKVKVMVGGAPVTRAYAAQIGATAFSADAIEAIETAKQLAKA